VKEGEWSASKFRQPRPEQKGGSDKKTDLDVIDAPRIALAVADLNEQTRGRQVQIEHEKVAGPSAYEERRESVFAELGEIRQPGSDAAATSHGVDERTGSIQAQNGTLLHLNGSVVPDSQCSFRP
jgi:hypothetical protein